MFDFIFDTCFFLSVYACVYLGSERLLRDHHGVFKVLFDVAIRINNFKEEMSEEQRHDTLHAISSVICFSFLGFIPVLQTFLYILFFQFIDVMTLNRLLLYITMLKLLKTAKCTTKFQNSFYTDLLQIVFIALNYTNTSVVVAVMFQLIDESFDIHHLIKYLDKVYDYVVGNDTWLRTLLWDMRTFVVSRELLLNKLRFSIMGAIVVFTLVFCELNTISEVMFYYYAGLRMLFVYNQNEFSKDN